jgi:hypothetical protein
MPKIGAQGYPIYGQQIQSAYPQTYRPIYQPPQPMQKNQPQIDPAMVNARYVTCKEEAVAAQIIPDGSAYYFICEAQGRIYSKRFNPATNAAEFREYVIQQNQPQAEQFAPMEALRALNTRVEQIEQILTAPHKEAKLE